MTSGGHNRKTKAQAERDGTARADRHVTAVVIAPGAPPKPAGLSDIASELWDELVPSFVDAQLLEKVDAIALEQLLEAAAMARIARERIGNQPVLEVTKYTKGGDEYIELQKNPAMGAWKDATSTLKSLLSEFGMTPLARTRLGDAARTPGQNGPQLPGGAPPAYTPPAASTPKPRAPRKKTPAATAKKPAVKPRKK